ncbi:putative carbohydrate-binding WSC, glyoxal oxidase, galactose oxidase/kelch, beta-propeller [Septoria linicola]|nr:putative carbohydrate-binding WSC, glyoxal oxidase, galactose oxidase/kelch, beta-propeller [Septoria linicola]
MAPRALTLVGTVLFLATTAASSALSIRQSTLSPAANNSLPTEWSYIGCYNESNPRALSGSTFTNETGMTGALCTAYCNSKNFVYGATEYGRECWCGNKLSAPTSLQNDTKCAMGCAGNSSEACGGPDYLTVYYANKPAPRGPAANPGPAGWSYQGCWTDSNTRTLTKATATPGGFSQATVGLCTSACAAGGYTLAGVEYAGECYCDNYLGKAGTLASEDDCNMPCNGNASEFCGAGNRLNLYASGTTKPTTKPVSKVPPRPVNWISMGCYSDNVGGRTLSYGAQVQGGSQNMTNNNCVQACQKAGYTIAGTEYSGECFCDNDFVGSDNSPATDGRCNMPCFGNDGEICGGPNGLSVLQFNGWYSQGCYTDNVGGRSLRYGQAVAGGGNNMSVEACTSACKKAGYKLAGVEYAAECFCDNTLQNGAGPASDGDAQCNMQCSGNNDQTCGGPNRLNLYSFDSKNLPTTTRTSTTATATSASQPAGSATGSTTGTATSATSSTQTTPSAKPTSGVNETAILPFKYQGCYTDTSASGRSLGNRQTDNSTQTIESCIAQCSSKGYTIAGMQYGVECYCDYFIRNAPTLQPDTDCNTNCPGNSGEKCGAGGRNSVYSNGTMQNYTAPTFLTDGLPENWTYTGCLADNVNNQRSLPYFLEFENDNSNGKCIKTCQEFGYTVAATEYGVQCYCGDTQNYIDAGVQMIANSSCNMRCPNDTAGSNGGEICGGQNALSVYTWKTPLNQWTFATGDDAGRFVQTVQGTVIPLITAPARNGKVTFVEKFGTSLTAGSTGAYEFDPSTGAFRTLHVKSDVFCAASLTLPDRAGRQINVGGWSAPSTRGVRLYWPDGSPGVAGKNDFEEDVDTLSLLAGRWYPSTMILANGSILVMGGEEGSNGAPVPSLELLPRTGNLLDCDYLRRTDPNNLYPFLIVLPSGNIFVGYYNEALLLDPVSLQPIRQLPNMPGSVDRPDSGRTYPFQGTAVILPQTAPFSDPVQVLVCGGSNPGVAIALDNCITIAPDQPGANWTMERMPSKRVMPYMAALPDGTYLITGGAHQGVAGFGLATDPNYNAVLYDPSKPVGKRMTVMANTTIARLYHSEAVLLDDGRVLVSGSDPEDNTYPQEYRNEFFLPPYLLGNKPRPAFDSADLDWAYGSTHTLSVSSSGSGGNMQVTAMGAVASTHGNSMGQRTFFLATSCSGGSCTVTAPPNANVCPPGWFQIFLLDGNKIPSTAVWVRIGGDPGQLGNWPNNTSFKQPGMGAPDRLF